MCVCVFMCLCVDVFVYLWKAINVDLCLYGIVVLWICVNPLSSLSVPFVIHSYVHMILFARSLRADGQDAVLSLRSCPRHRAMRYKRIETACAKRRAASFYAFVFGVVKTQDALFAVPTSDRRVNEFQEARSLQSCRQSVARIFDQRRWGRVVGQCHVLHLAPLHVEPCRVVLRPQHPSLHQVQPHRACYPHCSVYRACRMLPLRTSFRTQLLVLLIAELPFFV